MTASAAVVESEGDLIVRREGSAGIIRLNRPKALNAMTLEMSLGIDAALDRFESDPAIVSRNRLVEEIGGGPSGDKYDMATSRQLPFRRCKRHRGSRASVVARANGGRAGAD